MLTFPESQDIKVARGHLCQYYIQSRYTGAEDDWPPYHPKYYTPLPIIHHKGRHTESEITTIGQELSSNRVFESKNTYIDYDSQTH